MSPSTDQDFVLDEARRGAVRVLTFARVPSNHVSVPLLTALADALEACSADDGCRVVVLAAKGRAFCAGADLTPGAAAWGEDWLEQLYAQAKRVVACDKPLIAAVGGAAVGAGLGLALAADFRVVSPEARFWANFVKLGTHPGFGISHTLPRLIGTQRAALMLLTGCRVAGAQALDWGLADRMASRQRLRSVAIALANRIAHQPELRAGSDARAAFLATFSARLDRERAQQSGLRRTRDYAEGLKAVAERRPGRFVAA